MERLIKIFIWLLLLGFAGLVGYAYLADLTPQTIEIRQPVMLNAEG